MKMMTYRTVAILIAAPFALLSVACGGGDEGVTAENITLEECNDLFPEDDGSETEASADEDSDSEEMLEGDYDADGDVDEDDDAIEVRCVELQSEEEGAGDDSTEEAEQE